MSGRCFSWLCSHLHQPPSFLIGGQRGSYTCHFSSRRYKGKKIHVEIRQRECVFFFLAVLKIAALDGPEAAVLSLEWAAWTMTNTETITKDALRFSHIAEGPLLA